MTAAGPRLAPAQTSTIKKCSNGGLKRSVPPGADDQNQQPQPLTEVCADMAADCGRLPPCFAMCRQTLKHEQRTLLLSCRPTLVPPPIPLSFAHLLQPGARSAAAKQNPRLKRRRRNAQRAPIPRRFTAGLVSADMQNSLWNHIGHAPFPMQFNTWIRCGWSTNCETIRPLRLRRL